MSQSKSNSQFVWTKLILLFGCIVASASFVYLTWWSFGETREWFTFLDFDGNAWVSLSLALIFQYGQGPVLYLRLKFSQRHRELNAQVMRYGSPPKEHDNRFMKYSELVHDANTFWYAAQAFGLVFILFAVIDGWTNINQMHTGLDVKGLHGQTDKYVFTAVIGAVMVFIEEGLGLTVSMSGNLYNDIREIYDKSRFAWLDMFGKLAEEQLSGRQSGSEDTGSDRINQPVSSTQSGPARYRPVHKKAA